MALYFCCSHENQSGEDFSFAEEGPVSCQTLSALSGARFLRARDAVLPVSLDMSGVVQGSHLGLEIDVSTFRSVQDMFRHSKV